MSPVKSAIALFMADFLTAILREPLEDVNLFNYLELTVGELWRCPNSRVANFHLAFLLHLQHFLGIEPDWSTYTEGRVFDLADGIFRATPPLHGRYLVASEAAAAYALRRMTFRTAHIYKLSRTDRNQILDRVIQYYSTHFPGFGAVSSLDVLRSLFSF
jgi:DNA repair protein RecO (recombination protein O)